MTEPSRRTHPARAVGLAALFLASAAILWYLAQANRRRQAPDAEKRSEFKATLLRADREHRAGRPEAALEILRGIANAPSDVEFTAKFSAGTILVEMHRYREAETAFRQALRAAPERLEPHVDLAFIYIRRMQGANARIALAQIRKHRPWTVEEMALYTMAGRITNPVAEHIAALTAVLKVDPDDLDAAVALAKYRLYHAEPQAALAVLQTVLKRDPSRADAAGLLAEAYLSEGDLPAAKRALAQFPALATNGLARAAGWLALEENDWGRARDFLQLEYDSDPNDAAVVHRLETACRRLGDHRKAEKLKARHRALEELPKRMFVLQTVAGEERTGIAQGLLAVGDLLLELERGADAEPFFERALETAESAAAQRGLERARKLRSSTEKSLPNSSVMAGSSSKLPTDSAANPATAADPTFAFEDRAAELGVNFQYFNGEHPDRPVVETLGGGAAVFDYDSDGRQDLFCAQGNRLPNGGDPKHSDRLFRRDPTGKFVDVTKAAGLTDADFTLGTAVGDFDNDGFADLVATNVGRIAFYRNHGDGTFTESATPMGIAHRGPNTTAVFADLDLDGDLDLFVANYVEQSKVCRNKDGVAVVCHPRELQPTVSVLFENLGDGRFADVSASCGVRVPNGKGLGAVAADFDDDGRPDIYVSNDTTPNFLFHNTTPRDGQRIALAEGGWKAGAAVAGNGESRAGMGIACADFDGNGALDLFVTNFFAETNTLYRNLGSLSFADGTARAGLATPSRQMLGFGTVALDADLDGRPDLAVLNGHIYDNRHLDEPWKMRPQLFRNQGTTFREARFPPGGYMTGEYLGRGLATLDLNADGKPDLVATHLDRPVALLENRTSPTGHWLAIDCIGVAANRDGYNVRLSFRVGDSRRIVENVGGGYLCANQNRFFIGLGAANAVEDLEIRWLGGPIDRHKRLPADRLHLLVEGRRASR